jgi:peptidylprolyl isomerase
MRWIPLILLAGSLAVAQTPEPFLSETPVRSFPPTVLKANLDYLAEIETSKGRILVDLYEQQTPITVNSFVYLSLNRYFEGLRFHRIVPGFVAQVGDPKSANPALRNEWGTGGPGYNFGLEVNPRLNYDKAGVLGMARGSSPTSNGSQFFITFGPTPNLNQQYTIFGQVLEGMEVVRKLQNTEQDGKPLTLTPEQYDRIIRVTILTRPRTP